MKTIDRVNRHLISPVGSEAATNGGGGKIATFDGKTHVVWQDSTRRGYFNQVRTLEHECGRWTETFTLNRGVDNHARPVITVDHEGFLHVVMSGHNSPVTYRRSIEPNESTGWTEPEPAGSGTYPILICGPDDTLYMVLRSPDGWDGVDLYSKTRGGRWRFERKLVKRHEQYRGYGAFHAGLALGPDGELHMVVDFYEGKGIMDRRGLHQAVCYMHSRDGGGIWERSDGTPVKLPARPEDMDILARDTAPERHEPMPPPIVLSQGCIVADSRDEIHVLYVSHLNGPGELLHATPDDGKWVQRPIGALDEVCPGMRPVGCRGSLSIGEDDVLHVLLELYSLDVGWTVDGKPTREMRLLPGCRRRMVWLTSPDGFDTVGIEPALHDSEVFNQPNLERPTGVNRIPRDRRPGFVYFDGIQRYPEKGEVLQNNVYYFSDS